MKNVKLYYYKQYCRNKTVLDLICDIGYGANIISEVAKKVVAVDSSANAIQFGTQRYQRNPKLTFECIEKNNLPFEESTLDVIIANMVLEHIPPREIIIFLSEVKRVLKPNNIFLASTPNRKIRLLPFQKPFNPNHYKVFTNSQLKQCLIKALENEEILNLKTDKSKNKLLHENRRSVYFVWILAPMLQLIAIMTKILPVSSSELIHTLKDKVTNSGLRKGKTDQGGNAYLNEFKQMIIISTIMQQMIVSISKLSIRRLRV